METRALASAGEDRHQSQAGEETSPSPSLGSLGGSPGSCQDGQRVLVATGLVPTVLPTAQHPASETRDRLPAVPRVEEPHLTKEWALAACLEAIVPPLRLPKKNQKDFTASGEGRYKRKHKIKFCRPEAAVCMSSVSDCPTSASRKSCLSL